MDKTINFKGNILHIIALLFIATALLTSCKWTSNKSEDTARKPIKSSETYDERFGKTEEIIGNWFEKTKKRNEVILASKVCGPMREYVRGGGNQFGKKNITEALEGSLR